MKLLFVNACVRGSQSRTLRLCRDYMEKLKQADGPAHWEIEEIDLDALAPEPLSGELLAKRDGLLAAEDFSDEMFDAAKKLIAADRILVGAPYWDLSFPARLKIYLERCSVTGLTFIYDEQGVPHGQCRADSLVYITTSGAPIGDFNFGYDYIKGICLLFGVGKSEFISAEGLDIIGNDVEKIMAAAEEKISELVEKQTDGGSPQ